MFLYALFSSFKTFAFRIAIIPSATEVVSCLTSVLFFTLVTSKLVHETFVITVQTMTNFICFSSDTASKSVSFSDVFTDFTTFTPTSK